MNESDGRLISGEGESCPGCLSPYTREIGNPPTIVKRTARMFPGCSHNLCENCIAAEGDSTGQVSCRHPGCSTKVDWTHGTEEFLINQFFLGSAAVYNQKTLQSGPDGEREEIVTSTEPQENNFNECEEESLERVGEIQSSFKCTGSRFEPKELEASSGGEGGAKHKQGSRSNIEEEMTLARECAGCGKDIKKSKIQLMCACKWTIYCCEDCQKFSSHKCQEVSITDEGKSKLLRAIKDRYYRDRAAGRGPSSDRIKELAENIGKNERCLLSLAKDGHPIAAYLIGSAYLQGRVKVDKKYEYWNGEDIRPLGLIGKDYMWFGMPPEDLKKSYLETTEISIKWLKVAAEGGVPEAMFLLCMALSEDYGLEVDKRVAWYWLDQAYRTGKMEYLIESLVYGGIGMADEFKLLTYSDYKDGTREFISTRLGQLVLAARWEELKRWSGKTAKGEEFYGWAHFFKSVENVGGLVDTKKLKLVYSRPGGIDLVRQMVSKERKEINIKFKQGVKMEDNPDFKLIQKGAFSSKGRTAYLVTCKHDDFEAPENAGQVKKFVGGASLTFQANEDTLKFKKAGDCQPCAKDAWQRLRSVAEGQYSISLTQVIPDYGHAARYVTDNGVIMQDAFKSYSKPDLRQVLQCLMSNPADLHPLAVAEDQTLYWGIIWYWGSVYHAVLDTCNRSTVNKIFGKRFNEKSGNSAHAEGRNENVSGLAAFPESAAGEWRFACGNEACSKVDHEFKFLVCRGCKVRRYCGEVCQGKDWDKHKMFCKATK